MKYILITLFLISTTSVNAGSVQALGTVQNSLVRSSGIITSNVLFKSTQAANAATYLQKTVQIGKASMSAVLARRAFSPWGAAIIVAATAVGILLDSGAETYTINEPVTSELGNCTLNSFQLVTATLCIAQLSASDSNRPLIMTDWQASINGYKVVRESSPTWVVGWWQPDQGFIGDNPAGGDVLLNEEQFADLVLPQLTDQQVFDAVDGDISNDPQAISEIVQAASDLQTEYDLLNDADPLNDPTEVTPEDTAEELQAETLSDIEQELSDIKDSLEVPQNAPTSSQVDIDTGMDSIFDAIGTDLSNIGNETLIAAPTLNVNDFIKGEGTCTPFTISMGRYGTLDMAPFCSLYDGYLRDLMEWFLYGIMVFSIFNIWHETVLRVEA